MALVSLLCFVGLIQCSFRFATASRFSAGAFPGGRFLGKLGKKFGGDKHNPSDGIDKEAFAGKKVAPEDGRIYTFEELQDFYKDEFSQKEIVEYWNEECQEIKADEQFLLEAGNHLYENFFRFPYPSAPDNVSEKVKEVWYARRWQAHCGVERINHGLPNAMRKAVVIPVVVEAHRRFYVTPRNPRQRRGSVKHYHSWLSKGSFNFSSDMVKAMQIAIMFEAAGRQSEIGFPDDWKVYESFRLRSIQAFSDYAKPLFDNVTFKIAYDALSQMYMTPKTKESYAAQVILQRAHDLELLRCWEYAKMSKKLTEMMKELGGDARAVNATMSIATYVEDLMMVTGDNIQYRPSNGGRVRWACRTFNLNGHNPWKCLKSTQTVTPPVLEQVSDTGGRGQRRPATLPLPLPPPPETAF